MTRKFGSFPSWYIPQNALTLCAVLQSHLVCSAAVDLFKLFCSPMLQSCHMCPAAVLLCTAGDTLSRVIELAMAVFSRGEGQV